MYRANINSKTSIKVNKSYAGETIEMKMNRIMNNKEPITDGAPMIYTERGEGIKPEHDIRTDRMEVALEAMNYVHGSHLAKRQERIDAWRESQKTPEQKAAEAAAKEGKTDGGPETVQGTK